jgi:outer membrane protein assembly factor BamB
VDGNRVFITAQAEEGGKTSLLTICLDRETGKELWRHDFGLGVKQRTHEKSNLAVNTPAVTKDAVYVAFGNADIARYSHDGKLIWVTRYMELFGDPKMAWGYGVSPVVLDDSVLFPWDHHKGPCYLIGLDKDSGRIVEAGSADRHCPLYTPHRRASRPDRYSGLIEKPPDCIRRENTQTTVAVWRGRRAIQRRDYRKPGLW